jgi:hypothetical protein
MPAIASLEDLKAAQKDGVSICAMLYALRSWRRIGWRNVCKLWLQERTPEQLKGEEDEAQRAGVAMKSQKK